MERGSSRLLWLYLAVLGPLVILAFMAWAGSRAEMKAAWADAREQAERITRKESSRIAEDLAARTTGIPIYPDPPRPHERSNADSTLDSADIALLIALRDDPDAGTSPAGLPRRVLAALRIHELSPDTQDPDQIVKLITEEEPSVLSAHAIRRLKLSGPAVARWQQSENASKLLKGLPEIPTNGVWVRSGSRTWWLRSDGVSSSYIDPESLDETLSIGRDELPAWASLVASDLKQTKPNRNEVTLASYEIPFGPGTTLDFVADASQFTGNIRQRQRWILAILTVALCTAIISLVIIHRTVAREQKLADLKSQFVSSVSHELRAPLGSIRLMAEALQQEKVSKPAEFHTLIAREGARLSHLIENVLDFARIEEGCKYYHFEECDLTALLRDTLRLMQPIARERKVHLTFDLPEITATLDPAAIQQALVNLLDNAIKFSPEEGIIELSVQQLPDQKITITITDQGLGIPKSEHHNIFNRFHRLGNELRRETQGTGIGLSIVKHVAEAHHGTVTVKSAQPNGSTFTLTIPAQTPDN